MYICRYVDIRYTFFCQITTFIKVRVAFQSNGLKSKNKGHTNFYECCDLTKKLYLMGGSITTTGIYDTKLVI